jgi:hypothetical protein
MTYGQMGVVAGLEGSFEDCGRWLVRSIASFLKTHDQYEADRIRGKFLKFYSQAPLADREKLDAIWREANLGPFPAAPS